MRSEKAIALTKRLLSLSEKETSFSEKKHLKMVATMVESSKDKAFITNLTDQLYRSKNPKRTVDQIVFLIKYFGLPDFLSLINGMGFKAFEYFANDYPAFFLSLLKKELKKQIDPVLLPEDPKKLKAFFAKCKKEGTKINLNHLGEAILGEEEAKSRLLLYLSDLELQDIECISVKISTLFSQINLIAFEESLETLKERLRVLYRKAGKKFVYLDMEESKDLELTYLLFKEVMSEEEFKEASHGIALQSYLPESFEILKTLAEWSLKRDGVPISIRIVKGANLAMEQVESSLRLWPQAPFTTKAQVDANFKKMIDLALDPQYKNSLHVGVGSHNLFDISYALVTAKENGVLPRFEMLQGMAEPMRKTLQKSVPEMLLYSPEAKERDFQYACAYLLRRLDENTAPDNFLRHIFDLKVNSTAFEKQKENFLLSLELMPTLSHEKRKRQNRSKESFEGQEPFSNESDTDFSLKPNRDWVREIYNEWKTKKLPPSKSYNCEELNTLLNTCRRWQLPFEERKTILKRCSALFRQKRGELIGAMIVESNKIAEEGDIEVSEAIDFIEYYRQSSEELDPKGVVLIAPPWNFPCSIPVGGIVAALMAGNAVLFKPAPETVFIGSLLAQIFWEGGVSRDSLHFIPCQDDPEGSFLIKDPRVNVVVLTGATETARKLKQMRPSLDLIAETGGKNAMIVTAMADRDLAISDMVRSAFGHAGQKCSALSLAILEKEVYDDPHFMAQLKDAALSLKVGEATDPVTKVPPLIRPIDGPLKRALSLDEGESWLVEPQILNSNTLTPGIKLGVKEGSFTHQNELFGPVIGLMRAETLEHAIKLANATPYGLTSGLHSLDWREHSLWKEKIVAGNLYINRTITGAIVRRQPFGGTKGSSFGPGAKAGGPNYVRQLGIIRDKFPEEQEPLPPSIIPLLSYLKLNTDELSFWKRCAASYAFFAKKYRRPEDPSKVLGQDNLFYHLPFDKIIMRIEKSDDPLAIYQVIAAAACAKTPLIISSEAPFSAPQVIVEPYEAFLERLKGFGRLRLVHAPTPDLESYAAQRGIYIISSRPYMNGRFEILHYMREVSLSVNTHRYGYLNNFEL